MPYYDLDDLKHAAAGRWMEILVAAGLPAARLERPNQPCPKCGGTDRFSAFSDVNDRGAVHCRRCFTRGCTISPSDGIATLRWWLECSFSEALDFLANTLGVPARGGTADHSLARSFPRSSFSARVRDPNSVMQEDSVIESLTMFAREAYRRMTTETRQRLAQRLGVSIRSLQSLRVGVDPTYSSSSWPMRNAQDQVIGVRLATLPWKNAPASKWSLRQSRSGLFVPQRTERTAPPIPTGGLPGSGILHVTEGASDTATAATLGLWVIGRASCGSAGILVGRYVQKHHPVSLKIIADRDEAGIDGAKRLARDLCQNLPPSVSEITVIVPPAPFGDLREWFSAGAKRDDLKRVSAIDFLRPPRQATFDFA